ncbi:hypothetical protein R1flu_024691 [Riccia fluitans]|uniref:Uncharacterized protein n=1 Tax=Riccia fluitans TaxID=41844 RepID=A0ABD1XVM3_9MARC
MLCSTVTSQIVQVRLFHTCVFGSEYLYVVTCTGVLILDLWIVQLLLLCVGVLCIMFGTLEEAVTAFLVIFLMASAEVGTEWRAKRALNSLERSCPTEKTVKREGQHIKLDTRVLLPGDIVLLPAGMGVVYRTGTTTYLGKVLSSRRTTVKENYASESNERSFVGLEYFGLDTERVWGSLRIMKEYEVAGCYPVWSEFGFCDHSRGELPVLIVAVLAVGALTLSMQLTCFGTPRILVGTQQYGIRSNALEYVRQFDSEGLQKLFEAWLFMSDLGDDLENLTTNTCRQSEQEQEQLTSDVGEETTSSIGIEELEASSLHRVESDMFDGAVLYALDSSGSFLGETPYLDFLLPVKNFMFILRRHSRRN